LSYIYVNSQYFFKFATYEQKNIRIRINQIVDVIIPGSNLFKRDEMEEQDKYILKFSDGIVKAMYLEK
jgi:hypothetical protein